MSFEVVAAVAPGRVGLAAALFVVGACLGGLLNLGVYRLAWRRRRISPWGKAPDEAAPRRWCDRLPIAGWLSLRREAAIHGRGFWIRPMVVEVLSGAGLAALYWWEVERLGLIPPGVAAPSAAVLHATFLAHAVLIGLMIVASLIDVDEKTIPDAITVSGTLFALAAAAVMPWSLLPTALRMPAGGGPFGLPAMMPATDFLKLTSPDEWPARLSGFPHLLPLGIGLGCWWIWCVGLMHRTWYDRHGWMRAWGLMCVRLRRERSTWWILLMGLAGSAAIAGVWLLRGDRWAGLLSALVGMAASGGIIWVIRIVGTAVLRREAMGFGDVTLMAMMGAFLGWQPCLIVFILAPFAGLLFGLASLILRRGPEIPYGPFLCVAGLVVIVRWAALWEATASIFGLGEWLVMVMLLCLMVMVPLLMLTRLVRVAFEQWLR